MSHQFLFDYICICLLIYGFSCFSPPVIKSVSLCLPQRKDDEVFLDCHGIGVINILSAQLSRRVISASGNCLPPAPPQSMCAIEAINKDELLRHCMGEQKCTANVEMIPLSVCGGDSNFFQANYQCIPSKCNKLQINTSCTWVKDYPNQTCQLLTVV